MSGIVGIYHTDGQSVDHRDIRGMLDSIAHRGPDGAGVWSAGSIGLGHRLLWTTPESLQEQQPMSSENGDLWLTCDARVDNRGELRADLLAKGARLQTDTDAELVLRAYEIWGENCPARIIGDFAFAIWDARRQQLFCACDPIGIKSLYYHFDGKTLRWASEPHAIFVGGTISRLPNLKLICLSLLTGSGEREQTLYEGVLRLPPAHSLVLEGDRLRRVRYWDIDPTRKVRHRTDAEYAEHFLDLFRTAVAARLRSHGPVGALMSGGLDSTSVVCVAQKLIRDGNGPPDQLEVFSIIFDELPCDERHYIDAVVRKWDVRANHVRHETCSSWLDFERAEQYPDCFYTPTLWMNGPALEQARQKKIRTMLTGIGGDDLIASTVVHLTDLVRQGRIAELFRQLHYDADLVSCSRWSLFRDYCFRPLVPPATRAVFRSLLKPPTSTSVPTWLSSECLRNAGVSVPTNGTQEKRFPTSAQQRIYEKLVYGWNTNVALGRVECFASHFAIECRHPFFDRRLVEFMLAVPEEQRWFGPLRKTILRRAMAGILPESVRCRKGKTNFTPIVDREFKHRQADKAEQLLRTSILGDLGVIQVQEFQKLFKRYRHGTVSNSERTACKNVIGLELWCRSALGPAQN